MTIQKTGSERTHMGQKNSEGDKTKKINESSNSKHLKVWYSNADVLITDKLNELEVQIDCDYPDIACIAEVKPKNFIRTFSLIEYYINGYNLEAMNILEDEGKGMLLYIKKSIQYHLLDQFLFTSILTQEIIICELKTEDSNLLVNACVCRSPNSTVNNTGNLNVLLKNISDKYNANLMVLGDFNYPRIKWVHYSTNYCISDSNYKFLETNRDCFFQRYVKSSTRGRNSDNPSLLDLVLSNNDDLFDNVSLLSPFGKSDHSTLEVLVNYSSNNSTDKFYLDYKNTDFDSMRKIFNDEFNVTLKKITDVNAQLTYFVKTLNIANESFIPSKMF